MYWCIVIRKKLRCICDLLLEKSSLDKSNYWLQIYKFSLLPKLIKIWSISVFVNGRCIVVVGKGWYCCSFSLSKQPVWNKVLHFLRPWNRILRAETWWKKSGGEILVALFDKERIPLYNFTCLHSKSFTKRNVLGTISLPHCHNSSLNSKFPVVQTHGFGGSFF